ncbi:signal peptidase I [Archaeoglobus profundus]|uniref:Signal peptidase I n=1 Tax=Archaeoglobus profundus (strain DSM 5631 / JCM 9629 / NBRC 100127 / Av18) TaxID=572546 RepID=D2RHS5_ARCPA|nr:signal peptidase I [Archaeoglobus profundus]ADB57850.1 peptidase S26B, signal peptidase [Archaeoglobus profundus DSM 5631]
MKIGDVLTLFAVVFLLTSVVGFILDRPILLSYVTSDSMTPTLNKGDIFLINPLSKGKPGDIAVFKMNGHWTVHRIYAETSDGFITKGDNNVATDQQGGRNGVVKKEDVVGTVITVFGTPLKVPYVGSYLQDFSKSTKNLYIAILVIVLGSILLTSGREGARKRKKRVLKLKYKTLYTIISTITMAVFLISIVATWGTIGFNYASTLAGGQKEGWYLPNTEFDRPLTLKSKTIYPMLYILSPRGERITIDKSQCILMGKEKESLIVHVKVPSDTKIYYEQIDVYSYPLMLPPATIKSMWNFSPYLPLMAFTSEMALLLTVVYFVTGSGDEDVIRLRLRKRRYL